MDITNKNLLYKKINKIKFKKKSSGKLNSKARKGRKYTQNQWANRKHKTEEKL